MIQSYKKPFKLQAAYDVIVIGSGIGSLTTATLLAKSGKKVLILERHYTAGGFTHVFKRKGYEWDVGIHYIGEVQRPNSAIRKLFDYITDGKLQWADMGEVYDRVIIGEKQYDFVKGVKNFKAQMIHYFPMDATAIDRYVDLIFEANKAMKNFYLNKTLPQWVSRFLGTFLTKKYLKFTDQTTYEVLSTLTQNEALIKVLCGQYGDYGLPPRQSSFAMHASVVKHYFDGGSFPIGGSGVIVTYIEQVLATHQSDLLISAEVAEILVKRNKAIGVRMKDGKQFFAKAVVSGVGIFNTYDQLLAPESKWRARFKKQLQKIQPSVGHGCLYIGLNGTPQDLKLPKTNLWIYPQAKDHDTCVADYLADTTQAFPVVYISFPSAKDPSWSERYPGKSTIDIITLLPYETFAQWDGTQWMHRGSEYEALKEKVAQRLLTHLFAQLPHLKDHIDHYELSTPLTTKNFVNYSHGELYGIDHTPARFRQRFLKPLTPIKGLYLTGQDIVTAGVGGALFSGLITASAMTGRNYIKKIMRP